MSPLTSSSTISRNPSSGASIPSLALTQKLLSFEFMKHDKWSNVLFLHWKIPKELEYIIEHHISSSSLSLDRTPDGSVWIGLIFLTEQNVGPSFPLRKIFPCVTHHGLNIRTYVKRDDDNNNNKGIHFASLECDDRFTSWGANHFGMPYKVANMERKFSVAMGKNNNKTDNLKTDPVILSQKSTTDEIDKFICCNNENLWQRKKFFFSSSRLEQKKNPLLSLLTSWLPFSKSDEDLLHHSSIIEVTNIEEHREGSKVSKNSANMHNPLLCSATEGGGFAVHCEWEMKNEGNNDDIFKDDDEKSLAKFFVERYFVYTKKYGMNWRGQVHHEPWPTTNKVMLRHFSIENIDKYTPTSFHPLLHHFASTPPDNILFSPGVGPVHFQMLQPI